MIHSITILRGIAVLTVLFYHLKAIEIKFINDPVLPDFFKFGNIGVDIFFIISGIVIYISSKKYFDRRDVLTYLKRRLLRIYPVYWFYSLLLLPVFLLYPNLINSSQGSEVNLFKSFLLFPDSKLPLINVGWSLIHEMYFYLFFSVIILLPKFFKKTLIFWFLIILIVNNLFNLEKPVLKVIFSPLTYEFQFGLFIGYLISLKKFKNFFYYILFLNVIFLILNNLLWINNPDFINFKFFKFLNYFSLSSLVVVLTLYFENIFKNTFHFIKIIGLSSFTIYLTHVMTLNFFSYTYLIIFDNYIYDSYIFLSLMCILSLLSGILLYNLIEKKIQKFVIKFGI